MKRLLLAGLAMSAVAGLAVSAGGAAQASARAGHRAFGYVVNYAAATVVPLNLATRRLGRPVPVGEDPDAIAFAPDGSRVFVANGGVCGRRPGDTITVINTAANTVRATVRVGRCPFAMAVTPDGRTVYVLGVAGVTPVSTATDKAGPLIRLPSRPAALVITPDGRTAYVSCYDVNAVIPISTATNKTGRPIPVGSGPEALAVTPDGRTVYVVSSRFGRPDRNLGSVTAISTATDTAGRPMPVGTAPYGIVITPDGRTAYVTTDEPVVKVTPIQIAGNVIGKPITISPLARGAGPGWLALAGNGKTLYAASWTASTITAVATATNSRGRTIKVRQGGGPFAVTPSGSTIYLPIGIATLAISAATGKVQRVLKGAGSQVAIWP